MQINVGVALLAQVLNDVVIPKHRSDLARCHTVPECFHKVAVIFIFLKVGFGVFNELPGG